ncbi:MAG TPA: RHS repeat-associated core domain-containing protein [Ilumatobacter sp.]|nr:RHS repeat-associated core domain-containing protein [Ilumatobacter sp.]
MGESGSRVRILAAIAIAAVAAPTAVVAELGVAAAHAGTVDTASVADPSPQTVANAPVAAPAAATVATSGVSSLVPARLLDSRDGATTTDGLFSSIGTRDARTTLELLVTNRGGVPTDAAAVMLNVTAVGPTAPGFLTVFPCGQQLPLASNVNYTTGQVIPNAVLAKIGTGGKVCIYTSAPTHIVIDVNGYVPPPAPPPPPVTTTTTTTTTSTVPTVTTSTTVPTTSTTVPTTSTTTTTTSTTTTSTSTTTTTTSTTVPDAGPTIAIAPADWEPPATIPITGDPFTAPDLPVGQVHAVADTAELLAARHGGTVREAHAAVLTGRVLDLAGDPIEGVRVEVPDQPDAGFTRTAADGRYALAVNGGGSVLVEYSRPDMLTAQRRYDVVWGQWPDADDVVLVQADWQSELDLGLDGAVPAGGYLHVASTVAGGTADARAARLFIRGGTTAEAVLADGDRVPLGERWTLSISEYTVGELGPQAMPALLPESSSYTYASEFRIAEAEALGAVEVALANDAPGLSPAVLYLDDFLGFAVAGGPGQVVPTGVYDRQLGAWRAEPNGIVLRVTGVDGDGLALIEVDDSGEPAGAAELLALGIDAAERRLLADLPGVATDGSPIDLWRVEMSHFSPWDLNWPPSKPPEDAPPPPPLGPDDITESTPPPDGAPTDEGYGRIVLETRDLIEEIPLAGTGMSLVHVSARQPGRKTTLTVPVIAGEVPGELLEARVDVTIAGRRLRQVFTADQLAAGLMAEIVWDGTDAFGRRVVGSQVAQVDVTYLYPGYYAVPAMSDTTFALPGTRFEGDTWLLPARQPVTDSRRTLVPVAAQRSDSSGDGLGGWNISTHHSLDPLTGIIEYGDGSARDALTGGTIGHVAGILPGSCGWGELCAGDGGPATEATLSNSTEAIAVAPDGTIYLGGGYYLRAIDAVTGIITTVAGSGGWCNDFDEGPPSCVDGGLAAGSPVDPRSLAIAPDGTVLFGDRSARQIRRFDPVTGVVTTIAGTGQFCDDDALAGDNGPARAACLGNVATLGVSRDGTIVFDHGLGNRVRRIGPDGMIHTLLGYHRPGEPNGECRDDIGQMFAGTSTAVSPAALGLDPAIDVAVLLADTAQCPRIPSSGGLAVAPDGTVVFTTNYRWDNGEHIEHMNGIAALRPSGQLVPIAGFPTSEHSSENLWGDGGDALGAFLQPGRLAVGADGTIVMGAPGGFSASHRLMRRIGPDGRITTLAGYGGTGRPQVGGNAVPQQLTQTFPAIAPDGTVLFVDIGQSSVARVLRVEPPFGGFGAPGFRVADPLGTTVDVFDARGRHMRAESALTGATLREFTYTPDGLLATISDHVGDDGTPLTHDTVIERDSDGRPERIVGPYGQVIELGLDANGWLSTITTVTAGTEDDHVVTVESAANGLLLSVTGARGSDSTFSFDYDAVGAITAAEAPSGGPEPDRTTYTAHRDGATRSVQRTSPDGMIYTISWHATATGGSRRVTIDEHGAVAQTEELADGRIRSVAIDGTETIVTRAPDPRFGSAASYPAATELRTPDGKVVIVEIERTFDAGGEAEPATLTETRTVSAENGADARTTTAEFDFDTSTWTTTSPEQRVSSTVVDDWHRNVESVTPGQPVRTWERDDHGRVVALTEGTAPDARVTTYEYDSGPYLTAVIDAAGRRFEYDVDEWGRTTTLTRPDGEVVVSGHDAHGNVVTVEPPESAVHTQSYDARDRLVGYVAPGSLTTSFAYDSLGNVGEIVRADGQQLTYAREHGRLTARGGDGLAVAWEYNAHGRPTTAAGEATRTFTWDGSLAESTTTTNVLGGGDETVYTVGYQYDTTLRPVAEVIDGETVVRAYDDDGQLTAIGAQTVTRDTAGRVSTRSVGDVTVTYAYDTFGDLATLTATHDAATLYHEVLTRDALGRVTEREVTVDGATTEWEYGYDPAGRLATVTEDGVVREYEYDTNGNLESGPAGAGTYTGDDRLVSYGPRTYSFDDAGDLTAWTDGDAETQFDYDAAGLLRGLTLDDDTAVSYRYDGAERRVARLVDGVVERAWVYGDGPSPLIELAPNGEIVSRFVYGVTGDTPDYLTVGGEQLVVVSDSMGTPRLVVDPDGDIVERLDVDELGAVTSDLADWALVPLGFRGGMLDADTELVRFGWRDYDPTTGRFAGRDPILFAGGQANLYQFAAGDPVNRHDPTGAGPSNTEGSSGPSCPAPPQSTTGVGVSGSVTLGVGGVGGSVGIASDGQRPAVQVTISGGFGPGGKGSVTGYVSRSQGGLSTGASYSSSAGGSVGTVFGGGMEVTQDLNGNAGVITTAGVVVGAEAHANGNLTFTLTGPEYDPQPGLQDAALQAHYSNFSGCK